MPRAARLAAMRFIAHTQQIALVSILYVPVSKILLDTFSHLLAQMMPGSKHVEARNRLSARPRLNVFLARKAVSTISRNGYTSCSCCSTVQIG